MQRNQMSQSKVPSSSTPKLKSLTLACITALGLAAGVMSNSASAAPVSLQFNGYVNPGPEQAFITSPIFGIVNAGAFNFTITNALPNESFIAYCIELTQSIGSLVNNYQAISPTSYGWSNALQTKIAKLFESGYTTSLQNTVNSAGFQLALWEVVYDTGTYDLDSGNFRVAAASNVKNRAASYLAAINASSVGTNQFTIYASDTNQNFIRVSRSGNVPEPGTAFLLAGLGLVGFVGRRRRSSI